LEGWEADKIEAFQLLQEVVRAIRNQRSEKNVKPGVRLPATLVAGEYTPVLSEQAKSIATLGRLDGKKLTIVDALSTKPEGHVALVVGPVEIYLPMAEMINLTEERVRLEKELTGTEAQIERLETLLAGPFSQKAPETVVAKERDKLASFQATAAKLRKQIAEMRE
jgi:valyl-tRNA synthetase